MMGLRISFFGEVTAIGWIPVAYIAALVIAKVAVGLRLARLMGLSCYLGLLTGGAVAICGASAALAISAVLPKHEDRERNTLFTAVAVTTLSTLAMIAYPMLFGWLKLDQHTQGVLIGATIRDVAQVMGAAFSVSDGMGETATIIKLFRVGLLPVIVVGLALTLRSKESSSTREVVPLFVVGFVVTMFLNSLGVFPATDREAGV